MCQHETQKCLVAGAAQKVLNQFLFASESYSLCLDKKRRGKKAVFRIWILDMLYKRSKAPCSPYRDEE